MTADSAVLVLEDGSSYRGRAYGAQGRTLGEVVFATGMTGYQETLTDPSYAGQIVVMTAPHIGNTGVNDEDPESSRIWVSGYVVREPSRIVSSFRADGSLEDQLVRDGIVGISGIDTRAVTRRIRDAGAMRGGVFSGPDGALSIDEQLTLVRGAAEMTGQNLSGVVSTRELYRLPAEGERIGSVAVLDLGVKRSTLQYLAARGLEVIVVPQTITAPELLALQPTAVFFSNGPGDPSASDAHVELLQGRAPRGSAVLRHLLRQPAARPCPRLRHLQASVRPPRHQPAGAGPQHRPHRGHQPQPRLRGGCAGRRAGRVARRASAASGSAT